jgi:hypothetical protein
MEKQTISFKSIRENFIKELHGIKCCTIRKIEIEDERFIKLLSMEKNKDYGIIEINCDSSCFKRQIKDITCWDGWMVISWDNPDLIKETQRRIQKNLIKNSQLSFDNNFIMFDREWFYQNIEEDFKLNIEEVK